MISTQSSKKSAINNKKKLIAIPRNIVLLNGKVNTASDLFQNLLPKHVLTLIFLIGQHDIWKNTNRLLKDGGFLVSVDKLKTMRSKYNRKNEVVEMIEALQEHPYIEYIHSLSGVELSVKMSDFFFDEIAKGKPYYLDIELINKKEVLKSRDMMFYVMLIDFNGFSGKMDRRQILAVSNNIKSHSQKAVTLKQKANRIQKIKAAFQTLQVLGYLKSVAYHVLKKFHITFEGTTKQFKYTPIPKNDTWNGDDIIELVEQFEIKEKASMLLKIEKSNRYTDEFSFDF